MMLTFNSNIVKLIGLKVSTNVFNSGQSYFGGRLFYYRRPPNICNSQYRRPKNASFA